MLEKELLLEKDLFFFLNGSEFGFLDYFFWLYSYKLTWVPFYLCFILVFIYNYKKNWKEILLVLLSIGLVILLCDQISSGFFKPVFQRFRPTHHPDFQDQVSTVLGYRGGRYGFISSHAANAFGFATFTALIFKKRLFTITIMLFAIINGYSRIYLGVHFISDIIAGALVGAICAYLVYMLYNLCKVRFLNYNKEELKLSPYTNKQVYFLCGAYCLTILLILTLDNQLISYLNN